MRGACLGTWLVAAIAFAAHNAYAGISSRLVYFRSPDALVCPDRQHLEEAVSRRLGYSPFFPWADRTIVAEVSRDGTTFKARARLIDADGVVLGTRELAGAGSECEDLVASLALAISITLDPMSVVGKAAPPSPPAAPEVHDDDSIKIPPSVSDDAPKSDSSEQPRSAAKAARPTSLTLQAGTLARLGVLPSVVPGVRVGARLENKDFSLGVEGSTSWPASRTGPRGGEASFSLLLVTVSPCVRFGFIAGCALGSIGTLQGRGLGLDEPRKESVLYASMGARTMVFGALGRGWSLEGHADLQKGLTQPTFEINGVEVFRPAPFIFDLGFGLSTHFL